MEKERRIKDLFEFDKKVYIYFSTLTAAKDFAKKAENEGFCVKDGLTSVAVLLKDNSIKFISFGAHEEFCGAKDIIRMDYESYI